MHFQTMHFLQGRCIAVFGVFGQCIVACTGKTGDASVFFGSARGLTGNASLCKVVGLHGGSMIVLVCGGRDFVDKSLVFNTLDKVLAKYPEGLMIVHGAANGADALAEAWCKDREVMYVGVPARWKKWGKRAGPARNRQMRDLWEPKACIAFPGGVGTAGMVELMKEVGVEPWKVGWTE